MRRTCPCPLAAAGTQLNGVELGTDGLPLDVVLKPGVPFQVAGDNKMSFTLQLGGAALLRCRPPRFSYTRLPACVTFPESPCAVRLCCGSRLQRLCCTIVPRLKWRLAAALLLYQGYRPLASKLHSELETDCRKPHSCCCC